MSDDPVDVPIVGAGVELRPNCRVREIALDENGMASGVLYRDPEGRLQRQRAELVVLACNGIGTPRPMPSSKSRRLPDGIANRSGLVGKNPMFHPPPTAEPAAAGANGRPNGSIVPRPGRSMPATRRTTRFAALLLHGPESAARTMTSARHAG